MKKFRKITSVVLAILMVAAIACFSAGAATATITPKGTQIFFDNTATQWADVYIYGWSYGLSGEFIKLQETSTPDIYSYTLTEDVTDGSEFCLFVSQAGWGGRQTANVATVAGMNCVVPTVTATGNMPITWTHIDAPAPAPYVSATPSKSFAEQMDVVLYTNCESATYSINGGAAVAYVDGAKITINATSTIALIGKDELDEVVATATYSYTKVGMTTITASVANAAGRPVYAYLFGGDRIGAAFYEMTIAADGTYSIAFEGAAQVIFTTTNDWGTAQKLNTDEPLVAAGSTTNFDLVYPA